MHRIVDRSRGGLMARTRPALCPSRRSTGTAGFTLLELMTCIMIIVILSTMFIGGFQKMRSRAETTSCEQNLRSLYVSASAFIQDQGHWPQVDPALLQGDESSYARAWVQTLSPYGIARESWLCPTVQRQLGNPNVDRPKNERIDYIATPFGPEPRAPYQWQMQPWFLERTGGHEGGNRIVFPDGKVLPLEQVQRNVAPVQ